MPLVQDSVWGTAVINEPSANPFQAVPWLQRPGEIVGFRKTSTQPTAPDLGVVERGLPGYARSHTQIREFTTGVPKDPKNDRRENGYSDLEY